MALAWLGLVAGCAGPMRLDPPPGSARDTAPDSATIVLELRMRRSAELIDPRGPLRLFDQDLRVEYRASGRGPGLDAGDVTFEGRPLVRAADGKGAVRYRLGRDEPAGGTQAGDEPWVTVANSGGGQVAPTAARVRLAPLPLVTQPVPGQGVLRSEELSVVMLPPVAGIWYRVSLSGTGDTVHAVDLGEGRWLFPRGSLSGLASGRARVLIEVETSCGDCPAAGRMRADWSSRSELELALTLL